MKSNWLSLPLHAWRETQAALQLRTQMVGKTRLALAPAQNHWWHTTLYVTARGLTTSPMPYGTQSVEIDFDFIDHDLVLRTNSGSVKKLPLRPQSTAEFFHDYLALLRSVDVEIPLWPVPVEVAAPIPFAQDLGHAEYDRMAVQEFFQTLLQVDRVLKVFRGRFLGKCSPSHFWWGSFDMACTRFSGRRAPPHPGGFPNLADFVTREAYSHECISAGWWPGTVGGAVQDAAFYAYAYPEPAGCAEAPVRPGGARYETAMREWILPQEAVAASDDPDEVVLEFLQSTYDIASRLASWSDELVRKEPT